MEINSVITIRNPLMVFLKKHECEGIFMKVTFTNSMCILKSSKYLFTDH